MFPGGSIERDGAERAGGDGLARGVRGALGFLAGTQFTPGDEAARPWSWAGGWPSRVSLERFGLRLGREDVVSGLVAVVHHALARVGEGGAGIGLSTADLRSAGRLRRDAARFLRRFAVADPDTGIPSYGWWPEARAGHGSMFRRLGVGLLDSILGGPRLFGHLAPAAVPLFPASLRFWPDADDTALVYAALQDDARLDDGAPPDARLASLLARARDVNGLPCRTPPGIPRHSGAFLTWLVPEGAAGVVNDVDLVVNANALRALARAGCPDAPGASEAVALIADAVASGWHVRPDGLTLYYPANHSLEYAVTLACREGPVPALDATVGTLARHVESVARLDASGRASWGTPPSTVATALAVSTLAAAGGARDLVAAGRARLLATQAGDGAWDDDVLCCGETGRGIRVAWRSRAVTAALSMEALVG